MNDLYEEFISRIRGVAHSGSGTLPNTAELADRCIRDGIPGDMVECGVFSGVHPAMMAKVCSINGETSRRVHLFDSFEGIPEAGPMDCKPMQELLGGSQGRLRSSGVSACSMETVKLYMDSWGVDASLLVYHKGWVQDTLPATKMPGLCLLRLDVDLYESTKVCLEHLYPKVAAGGWIIADDYALAGCRKAIDEYMLKHDLSIQTEPVPGEGGARYWRKDG